MGASVLSGISGAASVAGLFGPPTGANARDFGQAEKIGSVASTGIGIAGALGSAGWLGGSSSAAAAFATMAGPIAIGAVAALALLSHIFHGADPLQVPAAQVQQVFDASCVNLIALVKRGYVTPAEASSGMDKLLSIGQAYYDQLLNPAISPATARDPRPFRNGRAGLARDVAGYKSQIPVLTMPLKLWNQSAAETVYVQPGAKGWYSASVQSAMTLTSGYVAALRAASPAPAPATVPAQAQTTRTQAQNATQGSASRSTLNVPLIAGGILLAAKLLFL